MNRAIVEILRFDEALFWELIFGNLSKGKGSEAPVKQFFLMKDSLR